MFRRQGREWGADRAELTALLARNRTGARGRRLVESAAAVGHRLHLGGSDEAAVAWLLAGTAALSAGLSTGMDLLDQAAQFRHGSTGLVRATGWRALALKRDALGDARGVLTACRRGSTSLDEHRASLGSSELRALADPARRRAGGAGVAPGGAQRSTRAAGVERAVAGRRRWRSHPSTHPTTLSWPATWRPCATPVAASPRRRRRAQPTAARLDDERTRLERAIRRRTHHLAGSLGRDHAVRGWHSWSTALDGTTFVELVDVDGVLHALVARSGRVHHVVVGDDQRGGAGGRVRPVRAAAGGPRATVRPGGRRASAARRRCWGTPYAASVTGPWSSLHPGGCTPLPGRWSRR